MSATATVELGNTQAYQDKLLGLLGQRDPIDVLASTPGVIAKIAGSRPAEVLQRRPFAGKWTPCEIIGHLCDGEWIYGWRLRLILCEKEPAIQSMDQDLWVTGQKYNLRNPRELAEEFGALRASNLHLWRGLSEADKRRGGKHAERGVETLGLMLRMNAGHDLSHIDQLNRYIAAIH